MTYKDVVIFDAIKTTEAAPVMRNIRPISEEHFRLIWRWMGEEMGLKDR